ncbi:MAG: hypothetical protein ISS19_19175 [Bacteroidales bacterium]|nr:hypothetical protein [Bacteroidales bacterium]
MKLYQKILGVSIIFLLASILVLGLLSIFYSDITFFAIAGLGLVPLAVIITLVFMFSYKNTIIRRFLLLSMPILLIMSFIAEIIGNGQLVAYLFFLLFIYSVLVNLIIHFLRYDLNLIIVIFLLIIGLYLKRMHAPGGSLVMTFSMMLTATFLILIAIKAFKIKNNRYLSMVMFLCSIILALLFIAFVWKIQHFPGAGLLLAISTPVFIIATLIILLTLPGSNFIEWTREQKKILTRGLLIPWLFMVYILCTTTLIPPRDEFKPFFFLRSQEKEIFFDMEDYKIENRNGLE